MDINALNNITYGLFVLTSADGDKQNGCIINTVMQVTVSPVQIAITVNKTNFTADLIKKSGASNISCIDESADFSIFKTFGFSSGRDCDKFADFKDFIKYEKIQCGFGLTLLMFLLFAIGFILLSYCFLDGCVRAYMLCISLLFFFISKKVAFRAVTVIIFLTLNALFFIPAKIWRRKRY